MRRLRWPFLSYGWLNTCWNCGDYANCVCPACLRSIAITALVVAFVEWLFR